MDNQDNRRQGGSPARGVVSDGDGDGDGGGDGSRDDSQRQQQQQEPPPNDAESPQQGQETLESLQQPQQQQVPPPQHQQQIPSYGSTWPQIPINAGFHPPLPPGPHAIAMAQYYEARMRDHVNASNGHGHDNDQSELIAQLRARIIQLEHQVIANSAPGAAAYASAAAGAAWAAAQIAAQAAEFATSALGPPPPTSLPVVDVAALATMHVPVDPHGMHLPHPNPGMYYPAVGPHNGGMYMAAMAPLGPPPPMMDPGEYYYNNNINIGHPHRRQGRFEEDPGDWQQQQQIQQQVHQNHHSNKRNNNANIEEEEEDRDGAERGYNVQDNADTHEYRNNRRKKMQRRPPGGISIPRQHYYGNNHHNNDTCHQHPINANISNNNSNNNNSCSRARRRLRDEHSSNSSCCSGSLGTSITSYNSDQAMGLATPSNHNLNYGVGYGNSSSSGGHRPGNNFHRGAQRGSGSDIGITNHHYHRYKKKQRQPTCDASLVGKTAVAALHEWCNKRRMGQPSFVLLSHVAREGGGGGDFEMAVYLEDGVEWGRGMGTSKTSTKQDAARKALMALLPGVLFDPESGILVELPSPLTPAVPHAPAIAGHPSRRRDASETSASAEDLAPHLEQRLAIASGREDDYEVHDGKNPASRLRAGKCGALDYSSKKLKRAWNIYPGTTSTTNSEEDDENAWYASRGASVCSALLHAMVQIDERLPEGPQYSFVISDIQTPNVQMKRKGPTSASSGSAIVIHRGSFTCRATLKVLSDPKATDDVDSDILQSPLRTAAEAKFDSGFESDDALCKQKQVSAGGKQEETPQKLPPFETKGIAQVTVLEAVAVGGSKRESKHTASAKLLAMLFPECKTMVEVKAAAEAAREKYAAIKSKKQQSKNFIGNFNSRGRHNQRDSHKTPRVSTSQLHAISSPADDDPPLPDFYKGQPQGLLGIQTREKMATRISSQVLGFEKLNLNQDREGSSDMPRHAKSDYQGRDHLDAPNATSAVPSVEYSLLCRQLSRQKQLEERVVKALQALNEHDEEGRSLPEEITADDVGRTVLRRAQTVEDVARIRLLLRNDTSCGTSAGYVPPVSILGAAASGSFADFGDGVSETCEDDGALALHLWGSSTIVLLLCRAIAAFEDPPLGCAVLTLGFSMSKGRLLRVAQMGSEPHLPRERFLECLDAFAACMNCTLDREGADGVQKGRQPSVRLAKRDLDAIVESNLGLKMSLSTSSRPAKDGQGANSFSAPLESVLEESGGECSDRSTDVPGKEKGQDKPSKRSRVE